MRFVRTMMAVLPMLGLCVPAYAQYGLYGAPSTLPLQSSPSVSQSAMPQSPPLYVDTNSANVSTMARPVAANPAPQYANPAYANPAYANPAYANPAYAYPQYGNPVYQAPSQMNNAAPAVLPRGSTLPQDPGYSTPIMPASAFQGTQGAKMPPPPVRAPTVAPAAPGPITQMLDQSQPTYPGYDQAGCSSCSGDYEAACADSCETCCDTCCPVWFGSVAGLYMSRNEPNRLWTTYESGVNPNQLPTDATPEWEPGGEVTIGRLFGCNTCDPCDPCGGSYSVAPSFGIEATYWMLGTLEGYSTQAVAGGNVSTPLIVSDIEFAGTNGTTYFDGASQHLVRRENEFHNIEINLFSARGNRFVDLAGMGYDGGRAVSVGWNLGVRYFRFEENFLFGSVAGGQTWGDAGGIYEAYLEDNVRNSLVGFQFGCDIDYSLSPRWKLYAAPKLGVYNNHVQHYFALSRGDGTVANPTAASGVTDTFPVNSSEDALSFLSEIDLGVDCQVAHNWSLFVGYRVVVATGIALADNQIPTYVVDIPEIADIDTNGDLILHGAFAGVTVRF